MQEILFTQKMLFFSKKLLQWKLFYVKIIMDIEMITKKEMIL